MEKMMRILPIHALLLLILGAPALAQNNITYVEPGTINVEDRSIDDWHDIEPVAILTPDNQWKKIRDRDPLAFSRPGENDLSARILLAWDGTYLYCAMRVVDDSVLFAPGQPWSGDSGELFFVGENLAFDGDVHDLVAQRKAGYGSVFQLIMNGSTMDANQALSDWRTYKNLILAMQRADLSVTGWKTQEGWEAEARIPLQPLRNVLETANAGGSVKIGLDILDYDHKISIPGPPHYGYYPDHVISNVPSENHLVKPISMVEFVFQRPSGTSK